MNTDKDLIWAILLHLSYNMWADREAPEWGVEHVSAQPQLRFDESLWDDLLQRAVRSGINMIVLDLGDGVRYESHPEIAVRGAWSVDRLRQEKGYLQTVWKPTLETCRQRHAEAMELLAQTNSTLPTRHPDHRPAASGR